jgi:hypothetical protein
MPVETAAGKFGRDSLVLMGTGAAVAATTFDTSCSTQEALVPKPTQAEAESPESAAYRQHRIKRWHEAKFGGCARSLGIPEHKIE